MAVQDKIIGGILLIHGSLGALWAWWVASQIDFPAVFLATNLALAVAGLAAGLGWLKRKRWGAYLAIAFFLVQLVHVLTTSFQWSFTLGFNLNVSLGWLESGELGINLLALVMLLWVGARAFAPNNSFKPNPLRGSA